MPEPFEKRAVTDCGVGLVACSHQMPSPGHEPDGDEGESGFEPSGHEWWVVAVAASARLGTLRQQISHLIAVGILEEHGVIAGRVLFGTIHRAFDVLRAGFADDAAESVDLLLRVCPERKTVCVATVARFLVQTR